MLPPNMGHFSCILSPICGRWVSFVLLVLEGRNQCERRLQALSTHTATGATRICGAFTAFVCDFMWNSKILNINDNKLARSVAKMWHAGWSIPLRLSPHAVLLTLSLSVRVLYALVCCAVLFIGQNVIPLWNAWCGRVPHCDAAKIEGNIGRFYFDLRITSCDDTIRETYCASDELEEDFCWRFSALQHKSIISDKQSEFCTALVNECCVTKNDLQSSRCHWPWTAIKTNRPRRHAQLI